LFHVDGQTDRQTDRERERQSFSNKQIPAFSKFREPVSKLKILFYPRLPDFRKFIAYRKVLRLSPLILLEKVTRE